jgi:hypothetical protein
MVNPGPIIVILAYELDPQTARELHKLQDCRGPPRAVAGTFPAAWVVISAAIDHRAWLVGPIPYFESYSNPARNDRLILILPWIDVMTAQKRRE